MMLSNLICTFVVKWLINVIRRVDNWKGVVLPTIELSLYIEVTSVFYTKCSLEIKIIVLIINTVFIRRQYVVYVGKSFDQS